jgi:opacity protein-like surface antigen
MGRSLLRIAFCIAGLLPLSARAADIPSPAPQYPPPQTLQYPPPAPLQPAPTEYKAPAPTRRYVCYAGAIVEGVDSHPTFYNVPVSGVDQDSFADGPRGGLLGGCDILFASHTFLGMDTSAVFGEARGSQLGFKYNMPYEWDTRVRVGYMLDDQWSVYVAGGAEDAYRTTTSPAGVMDNDFDWGGVVAVGFEYEFMPNWRVRGEYEFVWPGLSGISFPGSTNAQWAPSENLIRLAIVRTFAF